MKNKKNKKGFSLIDIIFSMGIIALVLTGVVTLIVSTSKIKMASLERNKAVQLGQKLIEEQILTVKNTDFWTLVEHPNSLDNSVTDEGFSNYKYNREYIDCTDGKKCTVKFTVKWDKDYSKSLSVERLFLRDGI